jgi:regulator of G-protein signaling
LIRCSSHASRDEWVSKLEEYSSTIVRAAKAKDGVRARRLTGTVDLAEATSLMRSFDSGTSGGSEGPQGDTSSKKTKASEKKKRQGLFGIGRQSSSSATNNKVEPVQNGSHPPNPFLSVPGQTLKMWSKSFDALLESKEGRKLFEDFLKSEVSQENLRFWLACENFKKSRHSEVAVNAAQIYDEFIKDLAAQQVNLDHKTHTVISENMKNPKLSTFDEAQRFIYQLMARDSYQRFLKTPQLQEALKYVSDTAT